MSKSPYIEASKHADFTRAVEGHFFGGEDPRRLVDSSPTSASPKNQNSVDAMWPAEGGTNYTPPSKAGHTVGDRK
jgi:hypothetical protein